MKKTKKLLSSMIAIAVIAFMFTNCGSSKKATKLSDLGQNLIEQHCTGTEFQSDKDFFRANAVGESMDQNVAKQKALTNARTLLAQQLEIVLQNVTVNYVKSSEAANIEDLSERFEGMTKEVTEQKLTGTRLICDKMTIKEDGNYVSYVAIELPGEEIANAMRQKLSEDQKLRIDYDYEKFRKDFEQEMIKHKERK